jgi:hypothetical protein
LKGSLVEGDRSIGVDVPLLAKKYGNILAGSFDLEHFG